MVKYSVKKESVQATQLAGRSVKVLSSALEVKNMTFGITEVPPHTTVKTHNHEQEELIFVLEGKGILQVGDELESLAPGTLIHVPSGFSHQTSNTGDQTLQFVFCFSPQAIIGSYDRK